MQFGHLRLTDAKQLGGFALVKTPPPDNPQNLGGRLGFRHVFVGIFNPQIREKVAAALADGCVVGHCFLPFLSDSDAGLSE